MKKEIINSKSAPAPIGPYNQAIKTGNLLFVSGQIPMDAHTGELILDDIHLATEKVMENLSAILAANNMTFEHVVKSSIFLKDMNDFSVVNEIYGKYFPDYAPARETVQVSGLPKNVSIEISVIAAL